MTGKVTRVYGSTDVIKFLVDVDGVGPIDLSAFTVKITIEKEDGTAVVTAATAGLTVQPTQTFTADAATDLLTKYEHGVEQGNQLLLTTTGTLPGALALATRYFVVQRNDLSFGLAATPDGLQINITSAGTGTHSFAIVGSGTYAPQSVLDVGLYRVWILLVGTTTAILPETQYGFSLEITPQGN